MHVYKSSLGLLITPLHGRLMVVFGNESILFPIMAGPDWKAASWIAECMTAKNPRETLYRKYLIASGYRIDGDTITLKKHVQERDEVHAVDYLFYRCNYLIDTTEA